MIPLVTTEHSIVLAACPDEDCPTCCRPEVVAAADRVIAQADAMRGIVSADRQFVLNFREGTATRDGDEQKTLIHA